MSRPTRSIHSAGSAARLRRAILLYSTGTLLLGCVLVAAATIIPMDQTIREQRGRRLAALAQAQASRTHAYFQEVRETSRHFAGRTGVRFKLEALIAGEVNLTDAREYLDESFTDAMDVHPGAAGLLCVDREGRQLAHIGLQIPPALQSGAALAGGPGLVPLVIDERCYLLTREDVLDSQDQPVARLLLLHEMDGLARILQDGLDIEPHEETRLIYLAKDRLHLRCTTRVEPVQQMDDVALWDSATAGNGALVHIRREDGSTDVMASARATTSDWVLCVRQKQAALYAEARQTMRQLVLFVFILVMTGAAGMYLVLEPLAGRLILHAQDLEAELRERTSTLAQEKETLENTTRDLERSKKELEAVNQELDAFTGIAAHDLASPLSNINMRAQILLNMSSDPLSPGCREGLERILANVRQADALLKAMLNFARAGKAPLQPQVVNLSDMAKNIAANLKSEAPERQVELTIARDLTITADPDLTYILLSNLLGNAWKYTSRRDRACIEVGITSEPNKDGSTILYVRDNGVGFDPLFADRLFEPFIRFHVSQEYPGTGLGLSTVKRILERHGGDIWANGAVGQGATFYFTFPTPQASAAPTGESDPA